MGVKSIDNTDRLYWLGRYSERVYTTLKLYGKRFDTMIENDTGGYEEFCRSLDIPNVYNSTEDFRSKYPFSLENPNSIFTNLKRAYDNAVELREEIGSETLAYVQLCIYEMNKAAISTAPMIEFQRIIDYLLAFWGIVDDQIEDQNTRNIIKVGKRVERVDLYGRLHESHKAMKREVNRLAGRVIRCNIHYKKEVIERLKMLVNEETLNYTEIVREIESILEA